MVTFVSLGSVRIEVGGAAVAFNVRRGLGLIAFLLEAPGPVSRDAAAELLWPEAEEGLGRTRLRRLLYRIEAAAPGLLMADGGSVGTEAASDALAFRHAAEAALRAGDAHALREAAELYGGSFLAALDLDDCPELADWAAARRLDYERLAMRVLRRLAEAEAAEGRLDAAIAAADRLRALEPVRETTHRLLLRLLAEAGERDEARRRHEAFSSLLADEFGAAPAPETAALAKQVLGTPAVAPDGSTMPAVRYADGPDGAVAYAGIGEGEQALVIAPGFVSHVELAWEDPPLRRFLMRLAGRRRVLIFDRRGQGLSERIGVRQSVDGVARDILRILDAEAIARATILGASEGAPSAIRLAHRRPERVERLVLFGALARGVWAEDYPHVLTAEQFKRWRRALVAGWGTPAALETFAPSRAADPAFRGWWARVLRHAATPASIRAALVALEKMDVRDLLPEVRTPTLALHRSGDRAVRLEAGRALAEAMPDARFVALRGDDHWFWCGDANRVLNEVEAFLA